MNIQGQLQAIFRTALADVAGGELDARRLTAEELTELVEMVRPSQDPKFGDYQANCAMPLAKRLKRPPREVAAALVERLKASAELAAICGPPEIAGPGFINLRLRDDWLTRQLTAAAADARLGIEPVGRPRKIVIDYSAPNVAKPMHVGHIRSTVIGEALYRVLNFLGHDVTSDNHLGDWGTQFGMIIYGLKHQEQFGFPTGATESVVELGRLYQKVNRLVGHEEKKARLRELETEVKLLEARAVGETTLPDVRKKLDELGARLGMLPPAIGGELASRFSPRPPDKKDNKALQRTLRRLDEMRAEIRETQDAVNAFEVELAENRGSATYEGIGPRVLEETAKLHSGDPENVRIWKQILPPCLSDIEQVYARLGVQFDEQLGESFYHDRLHAVVNALRQREIARETEGAVGVFLDDTDPEAPPFLVQKKDGAFLYATTDLATIEYRLERWHPDAILYVVDHRQSLHFEQLFKTARRWLGLENVELTHISFGTVLGEDGKPFKTRSGGTVGLSGLLDEAVRRARAIVDANSPELSEESRNAVAEAVGIGAIKYADLSQNRTSDYVFSYDKMLAMNGNTATYMQYAYARVRSIFARGQSELGAGGSAPLTPGPSPAKGRGEKAAAGDAISLESPAERGLALEILRLSEALEAVVSDYRPNHLTNYLFALAGRYSTFYEQCPVLKAETAELKRSRLALCDVTARTIRQGLALLGIEVVEKM